MFLRQTLETRVTLYFVCMVCDDRYVMDEDHVEVPGPPGQPPQRAGLEYAGHDCLCPVCEQFAGRLVNVPGTDA